MIRYLILLFVCIFIIGCAEIEPPMPDEVIDKVIKHPLGTDPLRMGMTKEEVESIWGKPDVVNIIGVSEGLGGTKKEEWIYHSRSDFPVDKGYLSKTRRLYFDGDNLIRFDE